MQLVVNQTDEDIETHRLIEQDRLLYEATWPLKCRRCGKRGNFGIEEWLDHEDKCL